MAHRTAIAQLGERDGASPVADRLLLIRHGVIVAEWNQALAMPHGNHRDMPVIGYVIPAIAAVA